MNNVSVFLDVALSLTFFYLIASMFVSGITEFINTLFEKRSNLLWEAIGKLQDSWAPDQKEAFQDHPLVKFFEHEKGMIWSRATSYINASTFVSVVLDKIGFSSITFPLKPTDIDSLLMNLENGDFKKVITIFLKESTNFEDFKKRLSNWFDLYMTEVSSWYKRYTRIVVWVVAIIVSIALNLNSIKITEKLYLDPTLRESMVNQALKVAKNKDFKTFEQNTQGDFLKYLQENDSSLVDSADTIIAKTKTDSTKLVDLYRQYDTTKNVSVKWTSVDFIKSVKNNKDTAISKFVKRVLVAKTSSDLQTLQVKENYIKYLQQNLSSLGLPMGWNKEMCDSINFLSFIGWLLTAAALSFGAPFWFDLLLKIVNIRNVTKQESTKS
jgi:hypothetical protein